ncbi:MAG: hypothetical protein C0424_10440 [Sphingobacteriaceae bacterium]|nr:hypothetical protein [Sphingobacteriaceae bacterium]
MMDSYEAKQICSGYFSSKKGYSCEIEGFCETEKNITFDVVVLKKGGFVAKQSCSLAIANELGPISQLRSTMEKFSAHVLNHLMH